MNSTQSSRTPQANVYTDDIRWQVVGSITPCMALALAALTMRLASRHIKRSKLIISDYLAIGSLVFSWIASLLVVTSVLFGLGLHIELVPLPKVRLLLINIFAAEIHYGIGFTLIKLSIITLYRQLFPTRFMLASTKILAVIIIMWGIAVVLVSVFNCNPIRGFWDYILPDYDVPTKCVNTRWFFIGISIPNIITDALLLCLPLRDVWGLQLPWNTKIIISGLFALGAFVIAASCMRIYSMISLDSSDPTWTFVAGAIWSAVEMQIGVVCCCLPTVGPVLAWLKQKFIIQ
ncbi:hypothetical protein F4805DRAFT_461281 [Annulohypoxylon moriforme]|nr:hypothetical protein F4805DRAFT_461281 [Annulohypoxylon moriforme]